MLQVVSNPPTGLVPPFTILAWLAMFNQLSVKGVESSVARFFNYTALFKLLF